MTSLKLKKMSVLLGVSAIALCTLSADPTISGYGYTQATAKITGTTSSDVAVTPYAEAGIVVEDAVDGASFYMENYVSYDTSESAATYSTGDLYVRYDATEDDFGSNYAMQFGLSYIGFTGANNYTAGDILQDDVTSWSDTCNLFVEAPVLSNDSGVLMLTPVVVFDMNSSDSGVGAIANYSFTDDGAISEVEGSFYYDNNDSDAKIGAGVVGNLGFDFGLAGNLNVTDTSDFDVSAYVSTTIDETSLSLDLLLVNVDTLYVRPEVDYAVNDAVTLYAYTEAEIDLDTQDISYDAELYATCYLADDFYVKPYIISDLDSSVSLKFKVGKSF